MKSIKLGFKGEISPEFFAKWKSTNRVRMRLSVEAFVSIVMIALSSYFVFKEYMLQQTQLLILMSYGTIAVLMTWVLGKVLYIWWDIYGIEKERTKEYYTRENKNKS